MCFCIVLKITKSSCKIGEKTAREGVAVLSR